MQELAREIWNFGLVCVRDSKVASISVIAGLALIVLFSKTKAFLLLQKSSISKEENIGLNQYYPLRTIY